MDKENDWRINTVTHTTKDWMNPWTNQIVKSGIRLEVVATVKNKVKKEFHFPIPNASAMMLNASRRAYRDSLILRRKNKIDIDNSKGFSSASYAIDYLERVMESVLCAHTALEAFSNEIIPDDYIYNGIDRHKEPQKMDKLAIERNLSLEIKLDKILPEVLNTKTPKGRMCWESFSKLNKLRNRIIHMKTIDRRSINFEETSIWNALVQSDASIINY
mgnify:CR=1 FL=1